MFVSVAHGGRVSHLKMTEEQLAAYEKRMQGFGVPPRPVYLMSKAEEPLKIKRPRGPAAHKKVSEIEALMDEQLRDYGLPPYERQHAPLEDRKFRIDFAWPDRMIGLEVDGAVHRIKGSFKQSFERNYQLMLLGWTVLHVGGDEVRKGIAIQWIQNILTR
jgi:very-short-patch-repair endonuclease